MSEVTDEPKVEQPKLPAGMPPLYVQLFHQCNSDPIADLLEEAKQALSPEVAREIRKPSSKIDRIVELKRAVEAGFIDSKMVYRLLRDSEETGQQHVFLYRPRSANAKIQIKNFALVATRLFDEAWGQDYFPKFALPNETMEFVDCRSDISGRPNDWIVKAYGHATRFKTVDRRREQVDENTFDEIRRVEREEVRTVMVARWRNPDVLEIRIDRVKSAGEEDIAARLRKFMEMLAPAFTSADLTAYQLLNAGEQLILERKNEKGIPNPAYRLNSVSLLDQGDGDMIFQPREPQHSIDDDAGRARTLETALNGGAQAVGLSVTWQPCTDAPKSLATPIATTIRGAACNELVFGARIAPEVFDYVINRLT